MKKGKHLIKTLSIAIIIVILIPTSLNFSQSHLQINNVPGSGSNNSGETSSSDNTFIYVAGGVILAGIIVFALLRDKKENKGEESDTTTTMNNSVVKGLSTYSSSNEYEKTNSSLPVSIFLGVKDDQIFIPSKTYTMGITVRF